MAYVAALLAGGLLFNAEEAAEAAEACAPEMATTPPLEAEPSPAFWCCSTEAEGNTPQVMSKSLYVDELTNRG